MKTIQVRIQNQTIYTINVKQISHFTSSDTEKGTLIHLSCRTEIYTLLSVNVLLDMIKRSGEEDLE